MAGNFIQCYVHIVYSVKGRLPLINENVQQDVNKYITGILKRMNELPICINGVPDHVHILCGLGSRHSIADIIKNVKASSSRYLKENGLVHPNFAWQDGYGLFSVCRSHRDNVVHYIENQQEHHKKFDFESEYRNLLIENGIAFDEKYLLG